MTPPSSTSAKVSCSVGTVDGGPCMPRLLTPRPVVLASDAISIIAFEPSTKLVSIFGFICFCAARSASDSGVA